MPPGAVVAVRRTLPKALGRWATTRARCQTRPVTEARRRDGADLAAASLAWTERWFDPDVGLLWNPEGAFDEEAPPRSVHLVPQSAWFALGLLARDDPGDRATAASVIEALVADQYDEPGTAWHGTFHRFHESPDPRPGAVEWVDYDPNWRQFVGTTFALVLRRHGERLDPALASRMEAAIRLAVEGEPPERVQASYSNIALMRAWLEVEAGEREGRRDWVQRGEALGGAVVERFDRHGAFDEYNSPTYYGVDLYALALWCREPVSAELAAGGAGVEAALWRDAARWYHAGLRNVCGPFTRSYGLDMGRYAGLLGLWVWEALGRDLAPYPDLGGRFEHSHDTTMGPVVAELGAAIPPEAVASLRAFDGERTVEQVVSEELGRVATGWLAPEVMLGGERGLLGTYAMGQYMPATGHWHGGALRVEHHAPTSATASPGRLQVEVRPHHRDGPKPVEVVVDDPRREDLAWAGSTLWLPGLALEVRGPGVGDARATADPLGLRVTIPAQDGERTYEIVVTG